MVSTRVGYAGGRAPHPTYARIGDHSECVEVTYDPAQISYTRLLAVFWESHHPGTPASKRQYRSAILYRDEREEQAAQASLRQQQARLGKLVTDIEPLTSFTSAEGYHQKYYLQQSPELYRELAAIYPRMEDLVRSTAAARVNGYLGGSGDLERLKADLPALGLSPRAQKLLLSTPVSPTCH